MSDEKPLGINATCHICGGTNRRTGTTRREPLPSGGLGIPDDPMWSEEFACTRCGRRTWSELGTDETPPPTR